MSVESTEKEPLEPKKRESPALPPEHNRFNYYLIRFFLRIFFGIAGRPKTFGSENVPTKGPVLLACNHCSHLDPPLIGCCFKRSVWFMGKEELFSVPIIGKILPHCQTFPVRRGTADRASLKAALNYLAHDQVVVLFPEGHRSPDGMLQPAELGVGMIALRSKATVIPVGIQGTGEMLPPGGKKLKRGHLKVTIGKPIDLADLYERRENRETLQACVNRIMAGIAELIGQPAPEAKSKAASTEGE